METYKKQEQIIKELGKTGVLTESLVEELLGLIPDKDKFEQKVDELIEIGVLEKEVVPTITVFDQATDNINQE